MVQQQSNSRNKWQALKWASALISRSNSQGQDTPSCLPGLGWISHQDQVILATGPHLLQEAKNLTFNTSLILAMVEIHLHNKRVFKAPSASPNNPGTIHLGTASSWPRYWSVRPHKSYHDIKSSPLFSYICSDKKLLTQ